MPGRHLFASVVRMPCRLSAAIALALAGAAFCLVPTSARADGAHDQGPPAPAAVASKAALPTTQLPRSVRPSHYRLEVTPHADQLGFDGQASIELDVLEPTATIVLNALDLEFRKVTLAPAKGRTMSAATVAVDDKAQTASFGFSRPLAPGRYTLWMDYKGKIGTQANGLFALDYTNEHGKQRALFTQFENSDARRFIPSWDEPAYKATFDLRGDRAGGADGGQQHAGGAAHRAGQWPGARSASAPRRRCRPTCCSSRWATSSGRPRPGRRHRGRRGHPARRAGARPPSRSKHRRSCCASYNDYFGMTYPLPKLDNVAVAGQQPVLRRHGELGRDLHLRVLAAGRSGDLHAVRSPAHLRRSPRTRSPTSGSATW